MGHMPKSSLSGCLFCVWQLVAMTMRKGIASTDREDQEEDEPQEDSRMSGAGDIIGRSSSVLHSDIWESLWKTERVVVLREEEDRDIAAALRASIASHLEQRSHVQERSSQKPRKEEKMEPDDMRNNRGTAKQTNEMQGMAIKKRVFIYLFVYLEVDEVSCLNIFQLDQWRIMSLWLVRTSQF